MIPVLTRDISRVVNKPGGGCGPRLFRALDQLTGQHASSPSEVAELLEDIDKDVSAAYRQWWGL